MDAAAEETLVSAIADAMSCLPEVNARTLEHVICHLHRFVERARRKGGFFPLLTVLQRTTLWTSPQ